MITSEEKWVRTVRTIYKCKPCGIVKRVDYKENVRRTTFDNGRTHTCIGSPYREDGQPVHLDYVCICSRQFKSVDVRGTKTDHKCDARCMGSTGKICECSCGGKNHGGKYL